jgi:hypothetical protein
MIFPSVGDAVDTARSLFHDLRRVPPDVAPAPSIDARAAVTWGEILLDGRGGRHGATINKAFRIDGLGRADVTQVEPGVTRESIPDGRRILLDEEAAQEARATGVTSDYLGLCPLKGFTGLHRVYLVDAG